MIFQFLRSSIIKIFRGRLLFSLPATSLLHFSNICNFGTLLSSLKSFESSHLQFFWSLKFSCICLSPPTFLHSSEIFRNLAFNGALNPYCIPPKTTSITPAFLIFLHSFDLVVQPSCIVYESSNLPVFIQVFQTYRIPLSAPNFLYSSEPTSHPAFFLS